MQSQSHSTNPINRNEAVSQMSNTNNPVWVLLLVVSVMVALIVGGYARARQTAPSDSEKNQAKNATNEKTVDEKNKKADKTIPENPFPNRVKAPSLEGGTAWLNTAGEITLKDLRGKIVLLDFWTYCCINCMHVLPDLKYLEKKYAKEIVVIGVHSAKFDNEKDSKNIRNAIVRYEIEHPVINDANMKVWQKFGARAWPTLIMIDPEGYYCGYVSGEGNRQLLEVVIEKLIAYHKAKKTLDRTPVSFALERKKIKSGPLRYPGKVLADEKSNRLFISDSNHNRIVMSTLDGKLIDTIGTGTIGQKDGSYAEASFDHPQGMALDGDTLYVADTENHLIRKIDLKNKTVSTLAGTGKQARRRIPEGKLREIALNSPWALQVVDGILYVCMAGPHQIWAHKLGSETIGVYAGSGREDILDGLLRESALAQPSGITTDGKFLYVADSEGSAIRKIALDPKGKVETIAGASNLPFGRSLFEFGDKDGLGGEARLQHPLGIAYHKNTLYVADAYNHKIRKIELTPKGGKVTTWIGDGTAGTQLNPPRLNEPEGVSIAAGKLFIADTNNHRICVADLKTGKMRELKIKGLTPPKRPDQTDSVLASNGNAAQTVANQKLAAGKSVQVSVAMTLPKNHKLNKDFPVRFKLTSKEAQSVIPTSFLKGRHPAKISGNTIEFELPLTQKSGKGTFELAISFGYCREGKGGLCRLKTTRWQIPIEVSAEGTLTKIPLKLVVKSSQPESKLGKLDLPAQQSE
ncbi:MAG: hypothetical protein Tsb009_15550 [Planctomycetaceae bacterium]